MRPKSFVPTCMSLVLASAAGLWACESDTLTPPPSNTPDDGGATTQEPTGDAGGSTKPLYALVSVITNNVSATTYVQLVDSLDGQSHLTLDGAREFSGFAPANPSGGKIIVSNGDKPQMTSFSLGEDHAWTEERTVSFANFTQKPVLWNLQASPTQAYVAFDGPNQIAWNPTDFTITGAVTAPDTIPLTRGGLSIAAGYGFAASGPYVYRSYYWSDLLFSQFSKESDVTVLDTRTNTFAAALEAPCPHFHVASTDDDGNVYFSNGSGSIPQAVLDANKPKNCVVRIKAGETQFDPTFDVHFRDLTDGREGGNFFDVGNGKAVFNVYHSERAPNVTSANDIVYSANYHLWTLDLATMKAAMTEGVDFAGGQVLVFRIDGRAFVSIPATTYSDSAIYEILPTGAAEKRFDTKGWVIEIFRVR